MRRRGQLPVDLSAIYNKNIQFDPILAGFFFFNCDIYSMEPNTAG